MNAPLQHPPPIRSTCPYCGVGCGVLARPDGEGGALIAGDPDHPANFGRLCSKGSALAETLGLGERLLHPMLRAADGLLRRVPWDTAVSRVLALRACRATGTMSSACAGSNTWVPAMAGAAAKIASNALASIPFFMVIIP